MAWKIQKNIQDGSPEIAISGWEEGIAPSPYVGLADIRNANILTQEKQTVVGWANTAITAPPTGYSGTAFTAAASDIFTVASTSGFYNGMALTIDTVSVPTAGATAGQTYYVGSISGNTFKLYRQPSMSNVQNITQSITGTFTVQTFGSPIDQCNGASTTFNANSSQNYKLAFMICTDGTVWYITNNSNSSLGGTIAENTLQFLGNTSHSTVGSPNTGISVFNGYLMCFFDTAIDYLPISTLDGGVNPSGAWVYNWKTITSSLVGHRAYWATDNALYFCNNQFIGGLLKVENETFDPTDSDTYTYNTEALKLPGFDYATCIAELGTSLLIGGVQNFVYPWNRISKSYNYPLILPEYATRCIVTSNSTAYIFAGQRGNVYMTNGSNIDLFKKFPDYLSGVVDPYYTWTWAIYWKNQIYFSITARTNSNVSVDTFSGLWALDLTTGALRFSNTLSHGLVTGSVPVILPMGNIRPTGDGLYTGWVNGATGGLDYTSGSPYTNYETQIDSDLIPIGTFLNPNTLSNLEFKLARPMVSGEGIKISWRGNQTDAFTLVGENTTVGTLSAIFTSNFQNTQWLQLRINMKSTASSPSYVPLSEILIRK